MYPRWAVQLGLLKNPAPTEAIPIIPETPRCSRTFHSLDIRLQKGEISPGSSAKKVRKALEAVLAEKVVLERDLERHRVVADLDRTARSRGQRARYPLGHLFDERNQESMLKSLKYGNWKRKEESAPAGLQHAELRVQRAQTRLRGAQKPGLQRGKVLHG